MAGINLRKAEYNEDLRQIWSRLDSLSYLTKPSRAGQLVVEAMRAYIRTPFTSLLSLLTISIALLLLGVCVLLFENIGNYLSDIETGFNVRIFLKDDVTEEGRGQLITWLKQETDVKGIDFISRDTALEEFRKELGEGGRGVLVGLEGQNPLPASLEVSFGESAFSRDMLADFAEKAKKQEQVEYVQASEGVMGQFISLLHFIRTGGLLMVAFLIMAVGFIIASTVRLALFSRLEEIAIMRLVGAPESYVKVPCLIEGGAQGLFGGVLSVLFLYGLFSSASGLISSSSIMSLFLIKFSFLSAGSVFFIVLTGVAVGVLASYLSIRRFVTV